MESFCNKILSSCCCSSSSSSRRRRRRRRRRRKKRRRRKRRRRSSSTSSIIGSSSMFVRLLVCVYMCMDIQVHVDMLSFSNNNCTLFQNIPVFLPPIRGEKLKCATDISRYVKLSLVTQEKSFKVKDFILVNLVGSILWFPIVCNFCSKISSGLV